MTLSLIGINYKTAPIELREKIAISREDLRRRLEPWPPFPV